MRRQSSLPLLFLFIFCLLCSALGAETWLVEGQWDYYALCEDSYRPDFTTASNTIRVYKDLGYGRLLIHSQARMIDSRRGAPLGQYSNPASLAQDQGWTADDIAPWYASDPVKAASLHALAQSIVGEGKTVEAVVEALGLWVRNKVLYALGSSTDPLTVASSGRAYCTGYANIMVALLRDFGIPARSLSCYVPPGNNWGGNSGGNHAFVAYYYPEVGWLCHDPQTSSNYVDPFHLVGFSGRVLAQYRQSIDASVVDYLPEPKTWETYSAAAPALAKPALTFAEHASDKRAFVLRLKDPDSRPLEFSAVAGLSNFRLDPSSAYFTQNYLGRPWMSMSSDSDINILADPQRVRVFQGRLPGWSTTFFKAESLPSSGPELLILNARSALMVKEIDLRPNGLMRHDLGLAREKSQALYFIDPANGKPRAKQSLQLGFRGRKESMETDQEGRILLCFLDSKDSPLEGLGLEINLGGLSYPCVYKPGSSLGLPEESGLEASLSSALRESGEKLKAGTGLLRLVVRDQTGRARPSLLGSAFLFDGAKAIPLSRREPGYYAADALEIGKAYSLRASLGSVNVLRQLPPLPPSGIVDIELELDKLRPARIVRANPFDPAPLTLYEYHSEGASPWPLQASGNAVLWDCPPASRLVSDKNSRSGVLRLFVEPGKELSYEPDLMTLEDFAFSEAYRQKAPSVLVGRLSSTARGIEGGAALLVNASKLSSQSLSIPKNGRFSSTALLPLQDYVLLYAQEGALLAFAFRSDSQGGAVLDIGLEKLGEPILCATGGYWDKKASRNVNIFLGSSTAPSPLFSYNLRGGHFFRFYCNLSACALSTEKTLVGSCLIKEGQALGPRNADKELLLAPTASDSELQARTESVIKALWPEAVPISYVRFADEGFEPWKQASLSLRQDGKDFKPSFDQFGYIQLSAPPGSALSFSYQRRGLLWRADFSMPVLPGMLALSQDSTRSIELWLKDGLKLSILQPRISGSSLALNERPLEADSSGRLSVNAPEKGQWFKASDMGIFYREPQAGSFKIEGKLALEQGQAWKALLEGASESGRHRVIDLRSYGEPYAAIRLTNEKGLSLPSSSPYPGIHLVLGVSALSLGLEYRQAGLFLRHSWTVGDDRVGRLVPDPRSLSRFFLKLSGLPAKTARAAVNLYLGGQLEGGAIKGATERISLNADAEGNLAFILPDGPWTVESGGQWRQFKAGSKPGLKLGIELK